MSTARVAPLPDRLRHLAMVLSAFAVLLASAGNSAAEEPVPSIAPPHLDGLIVRVDDFDRGLAFYREVAGFDLAAVDADAAHATLTNGSVMLWLIGVDSPVEHAFPGATEGHLNLQVGSLDATLGTLAERGVRRLLEEPLMAAIGPNMPILDPAGNILYVLQLNGFDGTLPAPKVFNFGLTIPDMKAARAFYEGVLGFQIFSEDYYPPVIPYLPAGQLSVVLHESAEGPAEPPAPNTAQMNLVLAVDDLATATRELASRGIVIRPSSLSALGRHVELIDPFGNVHVLLERGGTADDSGSDQGTP